MRLRRFIWIVAILWMGMIFFFSSRSKELSLQDSGQILVKVNLIQDEAQAIDVENKEVWNLQNWIRKTAHVVIYAGLGILLYLSLYGYVGRSLLTAPLAWIGTTVYAATDELHQHFVPGRGAMIDDVIRDSKGAFGACLAMAIIFLVIENWKGLYRLVNKVYNMDPRGRWGKEEIQV